jgi:MFS family permease
LVFIITFLFGVFAFKVIPYGEEEFSLLQSLIGSLYSLLFALIVTCLFKTLKEKLIQSFEHKKPLKFIDETKSHLGERNYLKALKSFSIGLFKLLVVLLGVLGFGAAQFCVFGSPICTFSVGAAIVTAIFPSFLIEFLYEYAAAIIVVAILLQILGLYVMGCFKKVKVMEGRN